MDEVELLRRWGGPGPGPAPSEASITMARAALQNSIDAPPRRWSASLRWARRQAHGGFRKVATLAGISTAAIMIQPARVVHSSRMYSNGPGDTRSARTVLLARSVTRPFRCIEDDAADPRRLVDELDDVRELPRQSPQYRCSFHGSP